MPNKPITRCRELRDRADLTLVELAAAARVSIDLIRRWEGATNEEQVSHLKMDGLERIAEVLGVVPSTIYPRLGRRHEGVE